MKRWIMIIDIEKCHNCNNCFLSCEDEHVGNDWLPVTKAMPRHGHYWRKIDCVERGSFPLIDVQYKPGNCMMCENAPCIAKGNGAVYRREDGLVLIDPEKAKGRKDLVDSCPYHAIWWNEEFSLPQKCTFCAHLLDQGWTETRCSHSCPTGATKMVQIEEEQLEDYIQAEGLSRYHDEYGTKPMVFYKNLKRFTHHFIGGSLIVDGECCEGATVCTKDKNGQQYCTKSNGYGDFKLDGLEEGEYMVTISYPGKETVVKEVTVAESVNLGDIVL